VQLDGRVGLDRVDERQHGGRIDLLGRRRAPREVLAHDRSLRFGDHDVRHTHQGSLVASQPCKSPKEALPCLKRRLSDAVYRCLLADARSPAVTE
jgi:hypothetical protein